MTEVKVTITTGENSIMKALNDKIKWDVKTLDVGDMLISKDDCHVACIERKTMSDLISSFQTGRYSDQKKRLLEFKEHTQCDLIYIIEGWAWSKSLSQVTGCIMSLQQAGFFVIQVSGVYQTVDVLQYLCKRYGENKATTTSYTPQSIVTLKLKPSDSLTPQSWLIHSLAIIPNVSIERAKRIVEVYPSLEVLIKALSEDSTILANIRVGNQNKRLGEILSKQIHTHLLCRESYT